MGLRAGSRISCCGSATFASIPMSMCDGIMGMEASLAASHAWLATGSDSSLVS